jgi:LacI family transcriptional regulator
MGPRIVDVAREAGVSPGAVSLALNNKSGVSTELRRHIVSVAERLGYSKISPELKSDRNINIRFLKIAKHGHVINDEHNAFITEYLLGIEEAASSRGYKLEISFFNKISCEEIAESQRKSSVNGFIILGTELNAYEPECFSILPAPFVFIDSFFTHSLWDCVDMDNQDGVYKAIECFYKMGHRRIGFINSKYQTRNSKMREAGFIEAMEYFSLSIQKKYFFRIDQAYDQVIADMGKILSKKPQLPTAVFCVNDNIALGCIKAFQNYQIRVPEDISVIGFDDLPSSVFSNPPLSSVRVSNRQIGRRALEKLVERITGSEELPETILVAGKLVQRKSVAKI